MIRQFRFGHVFVNEYLTSLAAVKIMCKFRLNLLKEKQLFKRFYDNRQNSNQNLLFNEMNFWNFEITTYLFRV